MNKSLIETLTSQKRISFHMPGHKNGRLLFSNPKLKTEQLLSLDTTELIDTDNLHSPQGAILYLQQKFAKHYHTFESRLLVGGTTSGILASILGVYEYAKDNHLPASNKIAIARRSHKSVYNAIAMADLDPIYITGGTQKGYSQADIISSLNNTKPPLPAVVLTHPSYEGHITDLEAVISLVKGQSPDTVVIVDEAHGASIHMQGFKNAVELGADISIMSLHKTLPVLGGVSLIHYSSRINSQIKAKIDRMLTVLQTSSPSYLMMTSAEYLIDNIFKETSIINEHLNRMKDIRMKLKPFLLPNDDMEKLIIRLPDAHNFAEFMMNEYGVFFEIVSKEYVLAMCSIATTDSDLNILHTGLTRYMKEREFLNQSDILFDGNALLPEKKMGIKEAMSLPSEMAAGERLIGRVASEFFTPYPPGIPILVPGELVDQNIFKIIGKNSLNVVK